MAKYLNFLLAMFVVLEVGAQQEYSFYSIQNYQHSTVLALKQQQGSKIVLDEYGKPVSITNPTGVDLHYLFNGQELDEELNIYFYPSRLYSAKETRFLQPDPKSQYFSPFLFVGADPVNYIDVTGNEGKSLFLFSENHATEAGVEDFVTDLKAQAGDGIIPMSLTDFANGVPADFTEFNGNIFIASHGSNDGSFLTETARTEEGILTKGKLRDVYLSEDDGLYHNVVDSDRLGVALRDFADNNGLEVKNIVTGSCQGAEGARGLSIGFKQKTAFQPPIARKNRPFTTAGVDEGHNTLWMGDRRLARAGYAPYGETRMYPVPAIGPGEPNAHSATILKDADGTERLTGYTIPGEGASPPIDVPYMSGAETRDLVQNARLPKSATGKFFKTFKFEY